MKKIILNAYFALLVISLLTPFWTFSKLQFPYITSKAFFFRIIIELALPLYAYLILVDKSFRPKLKNPLNIAVLIFLGVSIVSSFAGENVSRSLWGNFERMGGTYYLAHLVALYFYLQLLGQASTEYLKRFLQSFIFLAVLLTLNGISGWIGGPILVQDPSLPARVSSTFGNPIFFASYLIIPMFLAVYFAVTEEKRSWKIAYTVAVILQLVGIYSSGTRGAVVGLLIGSLVAFIAYIVLSTSSSVRKKGFAVVAVVVVLVSAMYIFHDKFTPGSTLHRIANLRDSNTDARLIQWKMALTGFKDRPVLGTGPENYYVIFDDYYNPELYKYDSSWFDKPHNFLIEILTTTGVLGFAAYISTFFLALYALWRTYKSGLLGLLESCTLLAALITYQVQNLFVFDTVSPSIAFFSFLGLIAYMWVESSEAVQVRQNEPIVSSGTARVVLVIFGVVMVYVLYISNIQSLQAAKRTNFGLAYSSYDPKVAASYFTSALELPFNLDVRETANRYSDFTALLVHTNLATKDPEFVNKHLEKALKTQKEITLKTENDPLLWLRLAVGEMNYAQWNNQSLEPAWFAIHKAVSLAPERAEIRQVKLQIHSAAKDWAGAVETAKEAIALNPHDPSLRWQLAMAYYLNGQIDEAIQTADQAVKEGFKFSQLQQFAWYIQYYDGQKNYAKVAQLLEQAVVLEPAEIGIQIDLVRVYIVLGDKEKAKDLAEQITIRDPSQAAAMQQLIAGLK